MLSMKILFLHGWQSIVGGVKPTYLQQQGHAVANPKLDDDDFAMAVQVAQTAFDLQRPEVIVGSSRGAAVAMHLDSDRVPLVLLCPAWQRYGGFRRLKRAAIILHSREDDVVPFAESEELLAKSRLPSDALFEVGSDHRLADAGSLAAMLWACEHMTSDAFTPWKRELSPNRILQQEGSYLCDACGEQIMIPLDLTAGAQQRYVEDCPVCCHPNIIHVVVDEAGQVDVWGEPEADAQ